MNWRLFIGSTFSRSLHFTLRRKHIPLKRIFPFSFSSSYDLQRFFGSRNINTIFDVGANEGQTVRNLVSYFPYSSIYCFEPVSKTFGLLKAKYSKHSNVEFYQIALGDAPSTRTIQLHENSELNTLVNDQPRVDDLTGELEQVEIDTINNVCLRKNIELIDLLKMDVQGWEMSVLNGASNLLSQGKIKAIISEVSFRHDAADMQHFSELNNRLEKEGFWLCGFYNVFRYGKNKAIIGFADALYIHKSALS